MQGMGATGTTRGTRGTGRSEGVVGVSSGGIELGLKVGGIGQLGISTDYGGGIVVGIFGQKIVWGREGGKIYYNFGGLEVIVEARDCVVVETRKILGQVVASHTYPDPGCKVPPEPEIPKADPFSLPPGALSPGDIDKAVPKRTCANLCVVWINFFDTDSANPYPTGREGICYKERNIRDESGGVTTEKVWCWESEYENTVWFDEIKDSLSSWFDYVITYSIGTTLDYFLIPENTRSECFSDIPPLLPFPPSAGNQPPMPNSCCESLTADIADLMEVLAVKEILAKKMTFPWSWRMPGGQGEEILMDYPSLMRAIAQQIDHLGIHPPKLSIKDINNAIAGDQSLTNQFPSVTQAFEALMAQVWDANADVDTLTNFLYRLAWLNVQQSFNMAQLTGSVESLKDMIGGETEPLETEITTPFNIAAGTEAKKAPLGKGFGKSPNGSGSIDNRIDANTEMSTEAMLPEFLKIRQNPILVDSFIGKQDIFDILLLIRADLEKLKNK